jgi:hypothetical protein
VVSTLSSGHSGASHRGVAPVRSSRGTAVWLSPGQGRPGSVTEVALGRPPPRRRVPLRGRARARREAASRERAH